MNEFRKLLAQAIDDLAQNGYDSQDRLQGWMNRLRGAANGAIPSDDILVDQIRVGLEAHLKRAVNLTNSLKRHPGVSRFTIERIKPEFRAELTRRIQASADLIKLNRKQAIEKTLQRFSGWGSSIPPGGSRAVSKRDTKEDVGKPLRQLKYEERRVAIDQGHKLAANVNATIASQGGAIAVEWHSRWRAPGYDYREDHKERDEKVYAIRGSWADTKGLLNKGAGYLDTITQFGEEPFCSCSGVYIYNLRDLPPDMLTEKGRAELERVRAIIANQI